MTGLSVATISASAVGAGLASIRWLRVAQREHYLPGSLFLFARRWWVRDPGHRVAATCAVGSVVGEGFVPGAGILGAIVVAVGPVGLGLRGRTGRLRWTRRLATIASIAAGEYGLAVGTAAVVGGLRLTATVLAAAAVGSPIILEIALLLDRPLESVVARRYVRLARGKLQRIRPIVVGITGSYGKTSTKNYVVHLLSGTFSVVASPRSFNNRAGLARAVNETLVVGTEIFVAEMGAYGPGEISAMVSWLAPRVAAITAIGPVHLERFRSLDRTFVAKAEIVAGADTVVLNVDDERLAGLADALVADGRRVIRCSAEDRGCDVAVITARIGAELNVSGSRVGDLVRDSSHPMALTNVACAVGVACALGVPLGDIAARLGSLPVVEHRLEVAASPSGVVVLDDTFNANPAGARLALAALAANALVGVRKVVVTPGMVELGARQTVENEIFAGEIARVATDLVVVGSTNRRALLAGALKASSARGASAPQLRAVTVGSRAAAVAWVRQELRRGDVVLYENDLPDQYP
ncbi:MAG TPA: Mur ligase family protein [Acidimicrobiales bacterium]|nr:Mur ligase family protein [Acidimicrobiales bacterium]